ncbi:CoA-disulfide reductase [Acetivibrio clariflavus]|uniref:NAD(FAD)-dependent dehydrogenase n=1 Tax=Acetivibrio clariflavus (strain DSM 19732 / NBRC 101661 / EBR45) TaxID=720554 RepID=G8LTX1_ACECE|nr:CoA-disulfide reductase [Acetivibrio clariflavus]AEV67317.1 NAD(FAD)-dependent dehydrogenase [Acetivibrio clariflavus DSM 19732]
MKLKVVIVGGVAGGASAATRLRRLDEDAEIILFEKGEYISFANCGLPYYIGEVIKEKDQLVVQTPEAMRKRFNIDVRINSEVTRIFPDKKMVEVCNIKDKTIYTETYDKLILSPGAEPVRPPIPGINSDRVFTLRNIPDTYKIKDFVDSMSPKRAVVVGAGFIGLEVAENLHTRGIKVTVVELADHVIGPMDLDMAAIVHQHLKSKGVELYLKDGVKSLSSANTCVVTELNSGKSLKADMVILGVGVRPETRLAVEAGLKIGTTGGIWVDEYMRTSNPDIYAVGDAVEVTDYITGKPSLIPLAGPANKQGRIAANNICGFAEKYEGTQGSSIVKVFDITVAMTGSNEKVLNRSNIEYEKSFTHSGSHAGYYPGAIPMTIKLLFGKKDGKILGAQIVGYEGVDKRIDVIATAIRAGMTVYDLEKLELAYAPPYSSAKDPVNIAGYSAANILKGDCEIFHWHDVESVDRSKSVLLDVRDEIEFSLGTIEGSVNIPLNELRNRLDELPKDKEILIFCQAGLRGYIAYRILKQKGFHAKNLSGGYKTYQLAVQKQSNEDVYEYDKITKSGEIKTVDCNGGECKADAKIKVDACGLQCPGPMMKLSESIKAMNYGEVLHIKATDPGFQEDVKAWCEKTGNKLLGINFENSCYNAYIRKEKQEDKKKADVRKNDKTMVVFSDDLDRAIASFIIANGAASMGRNVTMFFTFWGLNILRKSDKVDVKKDLFGKMFGFMMPRGSKKLFLSKMNMGGIGSRLIRRIMKKKNIASLEELIQSAMANGVELVACNMSMEVMGIKKEELIDGVKIGGVATFISAAEDSDMSLFI